MEKDTFTNPHDAAAKHCRCNSCHNSRCDVDGPCIEYNMAYDLFDDGQRDIKANLSHIYLILENNYFGTNVVKSYLSYDKAAYECPKDTEGKTYRIISIECDGKDLPIDVKLDLLKEKKDTTK